MARKKRKTEGYVLKSDVETLIQNLIRNIQMNDYGNDSGIPQLYTAMNRVGNLPTADVAPKSEVDDWKEIAETYQKMFEDSYSKYQAKVYELNSKLAKCQLDLRYSRNEIAREIFEEIENIAILNDYISVSDFYADHPMLAELKKKYTEEKK